MPKPKKGENPPSAASDRVPSSETPRAGKRGGRRSTTRAPGWGGEAKGAGRGKERPAFDGSEPGPGRGNFSEGGESRKEAQHRRVETLMDFLWSVVNGPAIDASHTTPTRVQAAKHLLDRIQGMPVQMVASVTTDDLSMMTDEELANDLERRGGKIRAFREAIMGTDVPG